MEPIFEQVPLLAAMEQLRRAHVLPLPPLLPELPKPLAAEVEAALASPDARRDAKTLRTLLAQDRPVFLLQPDPCAPGRMRTDSLEGLLGQKGVALLLAPRMPLTFPVHLLHDAKDRSAALPPRAKPVVSIAGLGDVGGTLLMGLRLLGGGTLEAIRIYDPSPEKMRRYYLEMNQVGDGDHLPPVIPEKGEGLFHCDALIFTVSLFIPPLDTALTDVRIVQLEKNKRVLLDYARRAEAAGFRGHYFIVSDPVDLLCQSLKVEGGIPGHRIRGFGLGVMEARARFLAKEAGWYHGDQRVAGPHGKGVLVFNSLEHYDAEISKTLSQRTEVENFRVRKTGFKPYIAPALSSGALPILAALRGEMHPSAFDAGTLFLGARNRWQDGFTVVEQVLPRVHLPRLQETEALLQRLYAESRTASDATP